MQQVQQQQALLARVILEDRLVPFVVQAGEVLVLLVFEALLTQEEMAAQELYQLLLVHQFNTQEAEVVHQIQTMQAIRPV